MITTRALWEPSAICRSLPAPRILGVQAAAFQLTLNYNSTTATYGRKPCSLNISPCCRTSCLAVCLCCQ
ncbi:hypothetical protein XELAEV_18028262mg [Xenopus laevis]|uniref:Uncharacterized protein n=1 Tax=Xenopus laevis TaxID=8355 RepID=A0A974CXV1_XENLA|nr:hypothetical protein XELAEV_18028262mg [Xenopus laevis]